MNIPAQQPFGIIDIGSNTIRLVIFDGLSRSPLILYTEKANCELARGLDKAGNLKPDKILVALANLERFSALLDTVGVETVKVMATSAVRLAQNGPAFAQKAEALLGHPVHIIPGEEEARYSALGVIAGFIEASGFVGDIGGGSLELAKVHQGKIGPSTTLTLGHQRLATLAESAPEGAQSIKTLIQEELTAIPWLKKLQRQRFYAVGSGWRRLAEAHMKFSHYPLPVVHHYALNADELLRFIQFRKNFLTREDLLRNIGFSKKQIETLIYASMVMEGLIQVGKPSEIIFSTNGLREGCVYDHLTPNKQAEDPLIVSCKAIAQQSNGLPPNAEELLEWVLRLFPDATPELSRLCYAACLLCQIAKVESRDFRSRNAFERVLYLPLTGISHPERVFLAMALHARYSGDVQADYTDPFLELIHPEDIQCAQELGMALRLGQSVCGETGAILMHTLLRVEDDKLILEAPLGMPFLVGEIVQKQLKALAEFLALRPTLIETDEPFEIPKHIQEHLPDLSELAAFPDS